MFYDMFDEMENVFDFIVSIIVFAVLVITLPIWFIIYGIYRLTE
jgi:hypothetical protein